MDNRLNLQEYFASFRSISEKRKVFFSIFQEMHRFHNNGEYIVNLSFQTISVCYTNPTDIQFYDYQRFGKMPLEDIMSIKQRNILTLIQMFVCSFIEYDFQNPMICLEVLQKGLPQIASYFLPVDYHYLERVLLQKEFLYYDDYIRKLEEPGSSSFQEKRSVSAREQAYTNYLLLTINVVVLFLLLSCIFLYLQK